jgi:hypothetical protein
MLLRFMEQQKVLKIGIMVAIPLVTTKGRAHSELSGVAGGSTEKDWR